MKAPGLLRRLVSGIASTTEEIDAAERREQAAQAGGTHIGEIRERGRACVTGTLRAVTLRPRAGLPALEAELYDGSGVLSICWLGRRRIPGITPGRQMRATGFISFPDGGPVMFNPRYELLSADD